ncbi:hypothetical protein OHQ88_09400 [Micromonospora zamorensis]|uniref:Uncharacterized protein n=1 Tax=Micromonospora zamorensis TaxID=709883 RepID=A0ABZ1PMC8_9ACTN
MDDPDDGDHVVEGFGAGEPLRLVIMVPATGDSVGAPSAARPPPSPPLVGGEVVDGGKIAGP